MKKYIDSNPKILGGEYVIKGTRIPVSRILFLLKDGYTVEAIQDDYPYVDINTIKGAIDESIELINNKSNVSYS